MSQLKLRGQGNCVVISTHSDGCKSFVIYLSYKYIIFYSF